MALSGPPQYIKVYAKKISKNSVQWFSKKMGLTHLNPFFSETTVPEIFKFFIDKL